MFVVELLHGVVCLLQKFLARNLFPLFMERTILIILLKNNSISLWLCSSDMGLPEKYISDNSYDLHPVQKEIIEYQSDY